MTYNKKRQKYNYLPDITGFLFLFSGIIGVPVANM